jgi:hypothetical protein
MTDQPAPHLVIAAQQQQLADAQLAAALNLARAQQAEARAQQAEQRAAAAETELEQLRADQPPTTEPQDDQS